MNSSTFSFKRELLVIATVLLGLLAGELAVRGAVAKYGSKVSNNLSKVARLNQEIASWHAAPQRPRMLILGNSVVVEALGDDSAGKSLDSLRQQLKDQAGHDVPTIGFIFHQMRISEWYWMVRQRLALSDEMPDLMVICLDENFARDRTKLELHVPAQFSPWNSLPMYPSEIVLFGDKVEFVISRYSQLNSIANNAGDALLERLFDGVDRWLPPPQGKAATGSFRAGRVWAFEMRSLALELKNKAQQRGAENADAVVSPRWAGNTYANLGRMLDLAREHQTRVVCFFMPEQTPYEIPDSLQTTIREHGGDWIDAQQMPGITPADFVDSMHLDPKIRSVFTPEFVKLLKPFLADSQK